MSYISLHDWKISTTKLPILNQKELDEMSDQISVPFPEMCYGNNRLVLEYKDQEILKFDAIDALKMVDTSKEGSDGIKVSYSSQWLASRWVSAW